MSSSSPDSPKQHGYSPDTVVPPKKCKFSEQNAVATLLKAADNTSNPSNSPDSRCSQVPLVPPNEQENSFKVVDITSNPPNSQHPSNVTGLSYFQLLECEAPNVQAIYLNKCNVLELNSLATVSRSLHVGAIATMARRSLTIYIFADDESGENHKGVHMLIEDDTDPSGNIVIKFCNCDSKEYTCRPWVKVQRLLYFCGHAFTMSINYQSHDPDNEDDDEYNDVSPANHITMQSAHSARSEWYLEELSVEKFLSLTNDSFDLLTFVSPRVLDVELSDDTLSESETAPAKLSAGFLSRGMLSAESVSINFEYQAGKFTLVTDEQMLLLNASSIRFYSDCFEDDYPTFVRWSPAGVSLFIEQWLRGNRDIKRVATFVTMPCDMTVPPTDREAVQFGGKLVEALRKLQEPPQIQVSQSINDDIMGQMLMHNGVKIYNEIEVCPEASVICVTATDGRKLTIVVTKGIYDDEPAQLGFIDIFPSS